MRIKRTISLLLLCSLMLGLMPLAQAAQLPDSQDISPESDTWINAVAYVNGTLCLGGKVCRKQMLGVHMPKNVDITGFSHFLPHPSGVRRMGVHWVFTPF